MRGPVDRALSTAEMTCQQTKQTAAHVDVSTYVLHPNTLCKLRTNTKRVTKKTTPLRFYTLSPQKQQNVKMIYDALKSMKLIMCEGNGALLKHLMRILKNK